MSLSYRLFTRADTDTLVTFLSTNAWPFHVNVNPSAEKVRRWIEEGDFDEDCESYWIHRDEQRLGIIRLEDLSDFTPTLDVRIAVAARGQGIGRQALKLITDHFFTTRPDRYRLEGNTRADNLAMQKVFRACGYVQEAYYRQAWPAQDKTYDAMGFAIIRDDWETGSRTPINLFSE